MSEIFVESMSFLNDCITQVLGGYSSAISSYFIEKTTFIPAAQRVSRMSVCRPASGIWTFWIPRLSW